MTSKWEQVPLGEVCKFQGGSQPPKSTFVYESKADYIRLIQIRDYKSDKHIVYIPKDKAKRFCNKDDVMIGRYGPPVFQILRGIEGAYNVALMKAIPDETVLTKDFLFNYLKSPGIQNYIIKLSTRAAGQSGLNKATIEPYPILLPSVSEQKHIVSILNEAFDGIDTAIANTEKNLANAHEMFESYLNSIFLRAGKSWKETALEEHIKFIDYRGKTPKKTESGLRLITAKNVRMGYLQRAPEEFVNPETYDSWMTRGIPLKDDVLFTTEAPLGLVCQLDTNEKVVFAQRIITMQPDRKVIEPAYLAFALRSALLQNRIHEKATGATAKGIKASLLKKITIPLPPLSEQNLIVEQLQSLLIEAKRLESLYKQKLTSLAELKQSLLQKAFSGELTVDSKELEEEAVA